MDALEYEKARIRMCRTMILKKGGCEACPMYNVLKRKCGFSASIISNHDIDTIKNNVDRVIKWAKDHSGKTRKSEFKKMFPNANMYSITTTFCTAHFDKKKACEVSVPSEEMCEKCRYKYWNEEVDN